MAWGIFKKIGQGIKKGFNWVKDHVVKPVAKFIAPVAKPLGGVVKTLLPGSAPIVDLAEGAVEKLSGSGAPPPVDGSSSPSFANNGGMVGANGHGIRVPVDGSSSLNFVNGSSSLSFANDGDWAKAFDNSRTLNRRIQLK